MKKILNIFFFKNYFFVGKASYHFKLKSFIILKKKHNYIYNLTYSISYLKKALNFIEHIVASRGLILFLGPLELEVINKFIIINNQIKLNSYTFGLKKNIIPGLLMKFKIYKKAPDLVIVLDVESSLYNILVKEATLCKIPVIFLIDNFQKFDVITYGIPSSISNLSNIKFYENLFCYSILNGFSKEKFKII